MFHEEAQGWLRDLPSGNTLVRFEKGEMLGGQYVQRHLSLVIYSNKQSRFAAVLASLESKSIPLVTH